MYNILHNISLQNKTVMHSGSCASYRGRRVEGSAGCRCVVRHGAAPGTTSCAAPGTTSPAREAGKVFPRRSTPALRPRGISATGVGNRDLALKPYSLPASHDLAPLGGGHDLLGHHVSAALKGCLEGNTCLRGGHWSPSWQLPIVNCLPPDSIRELQWTKVNLSSRLEWSADCINLAIWS